MMCVRWLVLVGCLLPSAASGAPEGDLPPGFDPTLLKRLSAEPRGEEPIEIDGVLDEPAWARAQVGDTFVERVPTPRALAPPGHRVQVLYDRDALYVGLRMPLAPGERPRALELTRDSFDIFSDDAVSLKFDVRRDQRTTVGFVVNAAGTQLDYLAIENGGQFRREYDAIWTAATRIEDDAWYAEFRLPVAALLVPPARGARVMGLNVTRDHSTRNATYDWAHMPPEFGATSALYYGELNDVQELGGGRPLVLIPYVLGNYDSDEPGDIDLDSGGSLNGQIGGDVRLRLLDDLWSELTIFPDFAQVDLDDPVVNFDRFPLFFPERRPFFLTGLEVFDFGVPQVNQLFFSRRIGLDAEGNEIPVDVGLKMYGSAGPWRVGLFQVLTGSQAAVEAASWTVARVRHNFGEVAHLGVLGTLRGDIAPFSDRDVPFRPDGSVGADGSLRLFDRRLVFTGFWAYSNNAEIQEADVQDPADRTDGMSAQASVAWVGEVLQPSLAVQYVDEEYDPAVGFVRRRDILQSNATLFFIKRPRSDQKLGFSGRLAVEALRASDRDLSLGQSFETFLSLDWRSGWNTSATGIYVEDVVETSFELLGERMVEPGTYRGFAGSWFLNSPAVRNPTLSLGYEVDTAFFGGVRHGPSVGTTVAVGPHFSTDTSAALAFSAFPDGFEEQTLTFNQKFTVAPSTKVQTDLIVQLNTVARIVTSLARLRWRYLPGSDIFLVGRYQNDYGEAPDDRFDLTLKVQFRYDLLL